MADSRRKEVPPELEQQLPEHLRMEAIRKIDGAPGPGRVGASGAYLAAIRERKKHLAELDSDFQGGRPKTRYTRAEAEAHALDEMLPTALKVIREQLESKDEKVRQSAAVKVLEYVKGKPTQTIQQELHQVSKIVYESAAFRPEYAGEIIDAEPLLELPPADEE